MLILCEKPSVARDFAAALGVPVSKSTAYQGDGYVITWCLGHLFEMRAPDYYNPKYKQWRVEDLPILPEKWAYETREAVKDRAECVINLIREHENDDVLIATDAGREGEYIARLCIQEAGVSDI